MATCNSAQAQKIYLKRVLETISAINACLPTSSGVQAISANLVNLCSTFEGAQSVLDLQLKAAICWLGNGGSAISCDWPSACPYFIVQTEGYDIPTLHLYAGDAKGFLVPDLVTTNGDVIFSPSIAFDPAPMPFLELASFPLLENVSGNVRIESQPVLSSALFPLLATVGGHFRVGSNADLTIIDVSSLVSTGAELWMDGNNAETVEFPSLTTVGDYFTINAEPVVPLLATVAGDIEIQRQGLTSYRLPSLTVFGGTSFKSQNCDLDVATVNHILVTLDAITPALSGVTILLNLGTSAAPTGAGAAAKVNLAVLNTVTTN